MRILVCTDGSDHGAETLHFAALIAEASHGSMVVLAVAESERDAPRARRALAKAERLLADAGLGPVATRLRRGHPAEQILAEAETGGYDLLIVGSRGQRGVTRFMLGSTAYRLARLSSIPVLIVRGNRRALRRVLVCTGGTTYGEKDVQVGGQLAMLTGAEVTVLHVMSQLPLIRAEQARDLERSAEEAMAQGTGEGAHLKRTLAVLKNAGLSGQAKLRYGLVVDEILAEAREGNYDLIVVGAHMATGWYTFLLDDVCNQIISHADRPVLVVRAQLHMMNGAS